MKKEDLKNSFGFDFDIENDDKILEINSPEGCLSGPYAVVHKSIPQRWAIVALHWDNKPRLGIRWFWDSNGNPISTGYPTWFIIPSLLQYALLLSLPIDNQLKADVNLFLIGELDGEKLKMNTFNTTLL